MKLDVERLIVLIESYFRKYEDRFVKANITVGRVRPYSKLMTSATYFEIAEEQINSLGETVVVRENIGDQIEKIVSVMFDEMGYVVKGITYSNIPGQEVSFSGLDIVCERKALDENAKTV